MFAVFYSTISFIHIGTVPLWPQAGNLNLSWKVSTKLIYDHGWLSSSYDDKKVCSSIHLGMVSCKEDGGHIITDGVSIWLQRSVHQKKNCISTVL